LGNLGEDQRDRRPVEAGLRGVRAVVEPDTEDLLGIGHRWAQPDIRHRPDGLGVAVGQQRLGRLAEPRQAVGRFGHDRPHAGPLHAVVEARTTCRGRGVDEPVTGHGDGGDPGAVALIAG
jgi:hypothetical protein